MTADFNLESCHGPPASEAQRVWAIQTPARNSQLLTLQLNLVFLDNRIGKQPFAHLFQRRLGVACIAFGKVQVNYFALAHLADRAKTQPVQGMANGLALRVQHAVLESYEDARFHLTRTGPLERDLCSRLAPIRA
jgi:hypothetical protein